MLYYIGGYNKKEEYVITMNMMLTDSGFSKLEKAYAAGKAFTVYWSTQKLYTYTVSGAPDSNVISMEGIFNEETAVRFYDTVNFRIEQRG